MPSATRVVLIRTRQRVQRDCWEFQAENVEQVQCRHLLRIAAVFRDRGCVTQLRKVRIWTEVTPPGRDSNADEPDQTTLSH